MRKKFPQAHLSVYQEQGQPKEPSFRFSEAESFPAGAISEIIPSGPEPILGLLLAEIMGEPKTCQNLPDLVLLDGDTFDPGSFENTTCSRLLWVRCANADSLFKAADLLIRDGNIPFVLLDTCAFPTAQLRALPASGWWRLKQIAERGRCRVLVLSQSPLVPCATLRLAISSKLSLADFDRPRSELFGELRTETQRLRHAT